MRFNVVLPVALAAVAIPTLAQPSASAPVFRRPALSDVTARDVLSLLARDDVLARSFGSDFVQGFEKGFTGTLKTVGPLVLGLLKREDEIDMLAREALRQASPHLYFITSLTSRGFSSEYVQRRSDLDERSFGSDFVQGFKKGFVGTLETVGPLALSFLKREDVEMAAREALVYVRSRCPSMSIAHYFVLAATT